MKVLSYLEYQTTEYDKRYFNEFGEFVKKHNINDLALFYSQSFKPELITELFEGWDEDEDEDNNYVNYKHRYFIQFPYTYNDVNYIIYMFDTQFCPPRTLDDFITDCQRAGINLEWKNEKI